MKDMGTERKNILFKGSMREPHGWREVHLLRMTGH